MATKICTRCHTEKPIEEFNKLYHPKYKHIRRSECKHCERQNRKTQKATIQYYRRKRARGKHKAVQYLGGKCMNPGCPLPKDFTVPDYAFDFHHRDPSQKDFNFKSFKNWEVVKKELDKCDLLCCLCHREVHYKQYEYNSTSPVPLNNTV